MADKRKKKKKRPKIAQTPPPRAPRFGGNPDGVMHERPTWSISEFDAEGPWGRDLCRQALATDVFPKMRHIESRSWGEIVADKKRDHAVAVSSLIPAARKRLKELLLDDVGELFRFRLTGKKRIWGIRDGEVFRLLWWDPDHEICPSALKNT